MILGLKKKKALDLPPPQPFRVPQTLPNASPLCPVLLGVEGKGKSQTDRPASSELVETKPQVKGWGLAPLPLISPPKRQYLTIAGDGITDRRRTRYVVNGSHRSLVLC